ncbi:MAG: acyl-CoA dehydrogenase [Egibacteraceae bacterium]
MATAPARPPDPDAGALRVFLDGEHRAVRERGRALLDSPEFAPVSGMTRAQYREQVYAWAHSLARAGHTGLGFPSEFGGGGDIGGSVAAFETLAHGDLSLLVKTGVQFGLFGGAVLHLGTRSHHERYLRAIATLELPGCFAMTETGHGSNVQGLRTTATYDPAAGEFVVHTPRAGALKDYIGNAAVHGRMAAVFAQLVVDGTSHGVHALLVPIRDDRGTVCEGVTITDCGDKVGLDGVDNGHISFDRVRVPRSALLDRFGHVTEDGRYTSPIDSPNRRFFTMIGTLIQGRVSISGAALSATKSALTIAVRYGLRRRQFGPPDGEEILLLDYRTHQRRLLPALATTYALHFAQGELVAELDRIFTTGDDEDRERRQLETMAAGLKAATTAHATATIQECREACGGQGYLAVNRFAALRADTDVFTTFEGDNTVLLQLVAKSLLTNYSEQFSDLNPLGMARFVTGQLVEAFVERSAARQVVGALRGVVPRRDDDGALGDRTLHLELFRWREEHVLAGVARRMKAGVDAGQDSFAVFLDCQDHVLTAARAHVDRLTLEAFVRAVDRCADAGLAATLDRLCDLYALHQIERDRGWFLEHGRLTAARSKAITKAVNDLCGEVRPHARALVAAFAVPDAFLAPIARDEP